MKRLLVLAAAAAMLTIGLVGAAFARGEDSAPPAGTPTPTATPKDDATPVGPGDSFGFGFSIQSGMGDNDEFLDTFAKKLGVTRDDLDSAYKASVLEMIDRAVKDGELGSKAAERLRESIEKGDIPFGLVFPLPLNVAPIQIPGLGIPDFAPPLGPAIGIGPFFGLQGDDSLDKVASFLGIKADALKDELNGDTTLAEVGEKHGKGRDELKAFLVGLVKNQLDKLADGGEIGSKVIEQMRAGADETVDSLLDAHFHFGDNEFGVSTGGAFEFSEGAAEPAVPALDNIVTLTG